MRDRRDGPAALQVIHRGADAGHYALVVHVDLRIVAQIGASGDLREDGLPRFYLVSVLIYLIIGIHEHALLLKIEHVAAYLVVAEIDVIAVLAVGDHGRVADVGKDAPHRGILLLGEIALLREVEMAGVVEDIVDLLHECVRHPQHHADDQRHADDEDNAPNARADDLPQRLLLLAVDVECLSYHRPDCEAEGERDADEGHRPVDIADDVVGEKHVDEITVSAVIFDPHKAREDLEHIIELVDEPAQGDLGVIQELKDRRVEDRFEHRG